MVGDAVVVVCIDGVPGVVTDGVDSGQSLSVVVNAIPGSVGVTLHDRSLKEVGLDDSTLGGSEHATTVLILYDPVLNAPKSLPAI